VVGTQQTQHCVNAAVSCTRQHSLTGAVYCMLCCAAWCLLLLQGLRQSAGIMVNYKYSPATIEANSAAYVTTGSVAVNEQVTQLL
jgi:hypothetical protein